MVKSTHNLVWIDCEMTGLNFDTDTILEIAVVITDGHLNVIAEGPSLVIHQPDAVLEKMGDWCQKQHRKSHLYEDVQQSTVTMAQAEQQVLEFIEHYVPPRTSPMCGSSVWNDRIFIMKHMPRVTDYLHYRCLDIAAIKELVLRWYGFSLSAQTTTGKQELHRALPDIYDSIKELQLYKDRFFVPTTTVEE